MSVGRQNLYYRISLSGTFMTCEDLRGGSDIVITLPEGVITSKKFGESSWKIYSKKKCGLE